ncbi:MAG: DUF4163 domain-containing protein [Erythrobacter sp.]
MRAPLFLISLLLSSAGCSDAKEYGQKAGVGPAVAAASASAGQAAPGKQAEAFAVKQEFRESGGGSFDFAYEWPASVSAEPDLAAQLDAHRRMMFDETKADWESSVMDCPEGAVSCRNYSYANSYEVIADLPRFLSLSNSFHTYTGGAHGMYGRGSQVWDREAGRLIDPKAMFVSQDALDRAVGRKACAALDRVRRERRGEALDGPAGEWPNNCPGLDEATLFLGSSTGKAFDRLGLYYGPYVAGPYAEGEYEVTLPVDAAVIAAVRPEFAKVFSVKP